MKKSLLLLLFIPFLLVNDCFSARVETERAPLNIRETDGSPSTYPYQLKVTNGQLTDNGDGTANLSVSGETTTVSDTTTINLTLTGSDITADGLYTAGDDLTLTGADFDVDATVTRDTEWDTLAEINTASTDADILIFQNLAVSGQTTVATDAVADTLTLAGGGITAITTNATTDTITFTSTEVDGSTTNEINTITLPDANVTAGVGITFTQAGIMAITESVADTVLFTATEVDGSITNELPIAGNLIDISGSPASTVDVDLTEAESVTWGAGAAATIVHTYNVSGTDTTMTMGSAATTFSGTVAGSNLSGTNTGDNTVATTGDSATSFFSSGILEVAIGGTGTTTSTGTGSVMLGTSPTITTSLIMSNGATIGQAAGPLLAFDDTLNYFEMTGGNVGIGTTAPAQLLDISGGAGLGGFALRSGGNIAAGFYTYGSGGSVTSPSATANNDELFFFDVYGYGDTGYKRAALIQAKAEATFSDTSSPGRLSFYTTPINSTSVSERMRIDNAGNVGIGTTGPTTALHVIGTINGSTAVQVGGNAVYYATGTDVAFADGGTGLSSWTQYLIPYAATTTSIGQIAIGTSGQVLTSNGAGVAPTFQAVSAGANTALSNLAAVAINLSLISDTNNTDDLGSTSIQWANTYTRDLLINDATVGTSGVGVIAIATGTIPSSSPANETQLYSEGATFSATGGTITTVGSDKVHTFTTSGTFTVTGSGNVQVLVVAGGAGGAAAYYGGGGGGGGIVEHAAKAVTEQAYTVTVGAGGTGGTVDETRGTSGSDSVFGDITAVGGGSGGAHAAVRPGASGGSGGGAGGNGVASGGAATQGASGGGTGYGFAGGDNTGFNGAGAGGGGGAAVGQNVTVQDIGGNGGAGRASTLQTDATQYYAAGGGGGVNDGGTVGVGGSSIGGNGGKTGLAATVGTVNTGSGGGGGGTSGIVGANGGSGIVIVRFTPTNTELKVKDSAGTATTLSPHNFKNIPNEVINQVKKDSNDLAWTYHSEKEGKEITVDMFNAIKDLEAVTGRKYIYNNNIIVSTPETKITRYFAEIKNNIVQRVIIANSKEWCEANLGGEWVETFTDNPLKNYAGKDYIYYPNKNNFSPTQPYPSWKLDNDCKWQAPVEMPKDGKMYIWNEDKQKWEMQ